VNPRPRPDAVARLYDGEYFTKTSSGRRGVGYDAYLDGEESEGLLRESRLRLDLAMRHVPLAGKRVLEVGCATGEVCQFVAQSGATVVGIDLSEEIIEEARRRFPEIAFEALPLELVRDEAGFDAVLAFEVVEHFPSPKVFFGAVGSLLRSGGYLALSTPNCDCARHIGWQQWLGFTRSFEHLHYLGIDQLLRYAAKAGLQLLEWYTLGGYEAPRTPSAVRTAVRALLTSLRLVNHARWARGVFRSDGPPFDRHGKRSDLIAVLVKP
jgi:cyclopropane fatty-acyl-phospholipid synthase-like methyltransferase